MSQSPYESDPKEYAERYSELGFHDKSFLEIQCTSDIIKRYTQGKPCFALDYGCGPGGSTLFLRSLGLDVEAVDINRSIIKIAQQRDPTGTYELIKSGEIQRPDGTYNLVYSAWVLVCINSKSELVKVCTEIARVLKRGGMLVLVVNSDDTFNKDWMPIDTRFELNRKLSSGCVTQLKFHHNDFIIYNYFWTEEDYIGVLKAAGLRLVRIDKPLGSNTDGQPWKSETMFPYLAVYVAKKP